MRLRMADYDQMFACDADAIAVTCDESVSVSASQAEEFIQSMFMDSPDLTFIATCECGRYRGNFYVGYKCDRCKTTVNTNFTGQLKFRAWLELPEFLPPVLHPVAYRILHGWLGGVGRANKTTDKLNSILNVESTPHPAYQGIIGQGMKYFYENFDDIFRYLVEHPATPSMKEKTADTVQYVIEHRQRLFVRHLPILNQALHLVTKAGTRKTYVDDASTHILKARNDLSALVCSHMNRQLSQRDQDARLKRVYDSYLDYLESITTEKLIPKRGLIRRQVLGARCHSSFRAVIVPITDAHDGDELYMPWHLTVPMYKLEILNKLTRKYHLPINDALAVHGAATVKYDERVDICLRELIEECPYKGLPTLFGRNPCSIHNLDIHRAAC